MKNSIYFISIIFFLFTIKLHAQAPPSATDFFEFEPIWSYLSEDVNFTILDTINIHQNEFGRQLLQDHVVVGDRLYILENLFNYGGLPFGEGYLMQCIDTESGEPVWERYNNYFSGEKYVESCSVGKLRIAGDGNLSMNGWRSIDSTELDPGCVLCVSYVNPMKHIIDIEDGSLLSEEFTTDTTVNNTKLLGYQGLGVAKEESMLRYYLRIGVDTIDGYLKNYLFLHHVDEHAVETKEPVFTYVHNTFIPNGLPGFSYDCQYQQLNEETGVGLFGTIDPTSHIGNTPVDLYLVYFDTSDPFNITVKKKVDILSRLVPNQEPTIGVVSLFPINGHLALTQGVRMIAEGQYVEQTVWISWYDDEGNEMNTIERFQNNGKAYDRISQLTYLNGRLYLTGQYKRASNLVRDTFELYELEQGGSPKLLSSFLGPDPNKVRFSGFRILDIDEEGDLIINTRIAYDGGGDAFSNANYILKYSGDNFGLTTSTKEEKIISDILVYPNPTNGMLSFSEDIASYELLNMNGGFIKRETRKIHSGDNLDMTDLPSGTYVINVTSIDGASKKATFIKK